MIEFVIALMWGVALLLPLSLVVLIWKFTFYVHNKDRLQTRLMIESMDDSASPWFLVKRMNGSLIKYRNGADWRGSYTHSVSSDGSLTVSIVSEFGLIAIDSFSAGSWLDCGTCMGVHYADTDTDVSLDEPA